MNEPFITTLAQLPFHVAGRFAETRVRRCTPDGFEELTGREFFERVRDVGLGLAGLGIRPGDRVGLICETRPEWLLADLGILSVGATTVPIYPTLPAHLIQFILADAGVGTVIASDESQVAKVREVRAELPELANIVVIDALDTPPAESSADGALEVSFDELASRGHQRLMHEDGLAREFKEAAYAIRADDLATIIYTSGTTGTPKGVMLTHDAILSNVIDAGQMATFDHTDEALSFLPLCHALERVVVYLYLYNGMTVTFAESLDTVARDMVRVKPTIMTGVPRVFEKLHARVLEAVASAPALRQWLFRWAVGVGRAHSGARLAGREPSLAVRLQHPLADRWCCPRSGTGWGDVSGSPSRVARRSRPRSPSFSSPSACRCSRGTD